MKSLSKKEKLVFARMFCAVAMAVCIYAIYHSHLITGSLYGIILLGLVVVFVKAESISEYFHSGRE